MQGVSQTQKHPLFGVSQGKWGLVIKSTVRWKKLVQTSMLGSVGFSLFDLIPVIENKENKKYSKKITFKTKYRMLGYHLAIDHININSNIK